MEEFTIDMNKAKANAQEIKKSEEERSQGKSDTRWYSLTQGMHILRFMPPWSREMAAEAKFDIPVYQHGNIPNHDDKSTYKSWTYTCPTWTFPDLRVECPICKIIEQLKQQSPADFKRFEARPKYLANVFPRQAETKTDLAKKGFALNSGWWYPVNSLIYVVGYPPTIHNALAKLLDNPAVGNFLSANEGVDIVITRGPEGSNPLYTVTNAAQRSKLHDDPVTASALLNGMYDINKLSILKKPDDAYLENLKKAAIKLAAIYSLPVANPPGGQHSGTQQPSTQQAPPPLFPPASATNTKKCPDGQDSFGKYRSAGVCMPCPWEMECKSITNANRK